MEHRINKIHERVVRLIYLFDSELAFKELLDKNKTVNIHQKNLEVPATEIFKAKLNISPEILKELFSFNVRKPMDTETNKSKFCVLWQRRPFLAGTEDMGLSDSFRQF